MKNKESERMSNTNMPGIAFGKIDNEGREHIIYGGYRNNKGRKKVKNNQRCIENMQRTGLIQHVQLQLRNIFGSFQVLLINQVWKNC